MCLAAGFAGWSALDFTSGLTSGLTLGWSLLDGWDGVARIALVGDVTGGVDDFAAFAGLVAGDMAGFTSRIFPLEGRDCAASVAGVVADLVAAFADFVAGVVADLVAGAVAAFAGLVA